MHNLSKIINLLTDIPIFDCIDKNIKSECNKRKENCMHLNKLDVNDDKYDFNDKI